MVLTANADPINAAYAVEGSKKVEHPVFKLWFVNCLPPHVLADTDLVCEATDPKKARQNRQRRDRRDTDECRQEQDGAEVNDRRRRKCGASLRHMQGRPFRDQRHNHELQTD